MKLGKSVCEFINRLSIEEGLCFSIPTSLWKNKVFEYSGGLTAAKSILQDAMPMTLFLFYSIDPPWRRS
jgi:hypothetical protein